jgi:acetyl esterase/lipase
MNRTKLVPISLPLHSIILCILLLPSMDSLLYAQDAQPLWPESAPYAEGEGEDDIPTLTAFLPEEVNSARSAIVIFPGGGYGHLAIDHEGYEVAERFNEAGIATFVVKYRYGEKYGHPVPLTDAKRAIRTVRSNAEKWNINPDRIGIIGFSAGGHLASTAGTYFDEGDHSAEDAIERQSSRPDFMVLVYPVITMSEEFMHEGSRRNLLGENPGPALADSLSTDKQITGRTPPAFLVHGSNDEGVPVENSLQFYRGLRDAGIATEMHLFEDGPHGFGLGEDHPQLSGWPDLLENWLRHRGLLK